MKVITHETHYMKSMVLLWSTIYETHYMKNKVLLWSTIYETHYMKNKVLLWSTSVEKEIVALPFFLFFFFFFLGLPFFIFYFCLFLAFFFLLAFLFFGQCSNNDDHHTSIDYNMRITTRSLEQDMTLYECLQWCTGMVQWIKSDMYEK